MLISLIFLLSLNTARSEEPTPPSRCEYLFYVDDMVGTYTVQDVNIPFGSPKIEFFWNIQTNSIARDQFRNAHQRLMDINSELNRIVEPFIDTTPEGDNYLVLSYRLQALQLEHITQLEFVSADEKLTGQLQISGLRDQVNKAFNAIIIKYSPVEGPALLSERASLTQFLRDYEQFRSQRPQNYTRPPD